MYIYIYIYIHKYTLLLLVADISTSFRPRRPEDPRGEARPDAAGLWGHESNAEDGEHPNRPRPGAEKVQGAAPGRERVQLVNIRTITFGLMNGGYIYSIHGGYKLTNITGGHHLVVKGRTWGTWSDYNLGGCGI